MTKTKQYAWKRLSDGAIVQAAVADSPGDLFELAGFGAVDTDKPLKGYVAVEVREEDGRLVEVKTS